MPSAADARALPTLPAFSAIASLATHPSPLSLRGIQRALGPLGPGPTTAVHRFRTRRRSPTAPGVLWLALGHLAFRPRSMAPVQPLMHRVMAAMHLQTISAGGSLADAGPCRAATHDALESEPSARLAANVLAIAQGVADTQADLEILRNGVSDIAETLENKIRDMRDLVQAEVRSEHKSPGSDESPIMKHSRAVMNG
eukprot:s10748_g3.t1